MAKIQTTKNYRIFERHCEENRPLDILHHKRLMESMKQYGFLESYPISVVRNGHDKLIVKDGQHRLMIAETLALPVYFVEDSTEFDVAIVNSAAKGWIIRDYVQKWAANGIHDYQAALEFAERHRIPITTGIALLSGNTNFSNVRRAVFDGTWRVKESKYADSVASLYSALASMDKRVKNARLIEACMSVCRVPEFDPKRLIAGAERCREKLVSYSTREAYLDMLEAVYNFGRKQLVGLKAASQMVMKERIPMNVKAGVKKVIAS